MQALLGFDETDFKELCATHGWPVFRAKQLFSWIYEKGVTDFQQMTNIPQTILATLQEQFHLMRPSLSKHQRSQDGTQKWLLTFQDQNQAECVHIPEKTRGTLCVSSQIGCTLTCKFCHTGTQMLVRNLSAGEIIAQVLMAKDLFQDFKKKPNDPKHVSNIVMMGMGEPLYNYDQVKKAILLMIQGVGISRHKITLSTSGVVPMIEKTGVELRVPLALSLHAVTNELRDHLVPLNKKYPLETLIPVVRQYPSLSQTDRVTFEYVMLKGVNDSLAEARALVQLIKGIPAKINLIPFNPWPGTSFERSTPKAIQSFSNHLINAGYMAPVRTPRGEDILAACGQLKSESERDSLKKMKERRCQSLSS